MRFWIIFLHIVLTHIGACYGQDARPQAPHLAQVDSSSNQNPQNENTPAPRTADDHVLATVQKVIQPFYPHQEIRLKADYPLAIKKIATQYGITAEPSLTPGASDTLDSQDSFTKEPGQTHILKACVRLMDALAVKRQGHDRFQVFISGFAHPIGLKVDTLLTVPVLNKPLSKGTIVTKDDVAYIRVPSPPSGRAYILNAKDMVGHEVSKNILKPFTAVLDGELHAPKILKKGDIIRIHYTHGCLSIQTRAKATCDGHAGGHYAFETLTSPKKMIYATLVDAQNALIALHDKGERRA